MGEAVYHVPGRDDAFDTDVPLVPLHAFSAERADAFDERKGTRIVELDLSRKLGVKGPATTPSMLGRYIVLREGDALPPLPAEGFEIYYVISGRGQSSKGAVTLEWKTGDVFCFSGPSASLHRPAASLHESVEARSILFACSDAPLFRFLGAAPSGEDHVVHYTADEIAAKMSAVYARNPEVKSWPVQLTTRALKKIHAATPSMTAGINPLEPGAVQPRHRHSAAALTMCIQGSGYSRIGGQKVDWEKYGVMLTPPLLPHSHHNTGEDYMINLTIQDAGLHFQLRTMGFTPLAAEAD